MGGDVLHRILIRSHNCWWLRRLAHLLKDIKHHLSKTVIHHAYHCAPVSTSRQQLRSRCYHCAP